MIGLTVLAVGKLKEPWLREGCGEYLKRLRLWSRPQVVEVEEYRLLNGWSKDKKRGATRFERMPLSLLGEVWVHGPEEYGRLLPEGLPRLFTSRELGKAVGLPPKKATLAANVLRNLGAIRQEGKRGNAYLYTVSEPGNGPVPETREAPV